MTERKVILMQDGKPLYEPYDVTFVDIERDEMYCPGCGRYDNTTRRAGESQPDLRNGEYILQKIECAYCGLSFYIPIKKKEVSL